MWNRSHTHKRRLTHIESSIRGSKNLLNVNLRNKLRFIEAKFTPTLHTIKGQTHAHAQPQRGATHLYIYICLRVHGRVQIKFAIAISWVSEWNCSPVFVCVRLCVHLYECVCVCICGRKKGLQNRLHVCVMATLRTNRLLGAGPSQNNNNNYSKITAITTFIAKRWRRVQNAHATTVSHTPIMVHKRQKGKWHTNTKHTHIHTRTHENMEFLLLLPLFCNNC